MKNNILEIQRGPHPSTMKLKLKLKLLHERNVVYPMDYGYMMYQENELENEQIICVINRKIRAFDIYLGKYLMHQK